MTPTVEVFDDLEALSFAGARLVAASARDAVSAWGRFTWVLSGGRTPRRLYEYVAQGLGGTVPWPFVHLLWGDERIVPPTDPGSNYRMADETLVRKVAIPAVNVHRVPAEMRPPDAAARAYEASLRELTGDAPAFDLVLLGLGADGHTASLFPGSTALEETARWVVPSNAPEGVTPRRRLSLTLPALNLARRVVFLVSGAEKARAVKAILGGAPPGAPLPAARVKPVGQVFWLLDRLAAGAL